MCGWELDGGRQLCGECQRAWLESPEGGRAHATPERADSMLADFVRRVVGEGAHRG